MLFFRLRTKLKHLLIPTGIEWGLELVLHKNINSNNHTMKRTAVLFIAVLFILSFSSCRKELQTVDTEPVNPEMGILDLNVPSDFNFATSSEVTLNIGGFKSSSAKVKYNIYLYKPDGNMETSTVMGDGGNEVTQSIQQVDALSNLAASVITDKSSFDIKLTVPNFYSSIYVVRNDNGKYSSQILPVNSNKMSANFNDNSSSTKSAKADTYTVDMIYGVNGSSEVFQINSETGEFKLVTSIPEWNNGSYTCAIDPVKEILYAVGLVYPYNLFAYDIAADSWTKIGSTYVYGPRLAYNIKDGLLYYSYNDRIALIDPSNAKMVSSAKIKGLKSKDGGDIAFSADGSLYLSTVSGIYSLTQKKKDFDAKLISKDLTNYPTSLGFGYADTFWGATNVNGKGQVFTYDLDSNKESLQFSAFDHSIDDIAVLPVEIEKVIENDADGDGIIDIYDEYPNDAERATNVFTPSISGVGSYAFEDLWPAQGDYDFNDLIVNYRFQNVLNAQGMVVETKMYFYVKNVGGSFKNGFGIDLDMNSDLIRQVSGCNYTEGLVSVNSKGLEENQDQAVIIVFDNSHNTPETLEINVAYTTPIPQDVIGVFNPFIFVNGNRGREVHMADFKPTSLADTSLFGTGDDASNMASGLYYKNKNNLPWGINILYDFTAPLEKSPINLGYTKFDAWASSGGTEYPDWYTDADGYRDTNYLVVE
jgi:LruC domain-containing protein